MKAEVVFNNWVRQSGSSTSTSLRFGPQNQCILWHSEQNPAPLRGQAVRMAGVRITETLIVYRASLHQEKSFITRLMREYDGRPVFEGDFEIISRIVPSIFLEFRDYEIDAHRDRISFDIVDHSSVEKHYGGLFNRDTIINAAIDGFPRGGSRHDAMNLTDLECLDLILTRYGLDNPIGTTEDSILKYFNREHLSSRYGIASKVDKAVKLDELRDQGIDSARLGDYVFFKSEEDLAMATIVYPDIPAGLYL